MVPLRTSSPRMAPVASGNRAIATGILFVAFFTVGTLLMAIDEVALPPIVTSALFTLFGAAFIYLLFWVAETLTREAADNNRADRIADLLPELRAAVAPDRDRLASVVWEASRADEGTISATGANVVADAIIRDQADTRAARRASYQQQLDDLPEDLTDAQRDDLATSWSVP